MTLAQQRAALDRVIAKATNIPAANDLAERLAKSMTRSVVSAQPPDVAVIVRGVMQAIAPYIRELQADAAELRERLDELEDRA